MDAKKKPRSGAAVRRFVAWHRRKLAAASAMAAVAATVAAVSPSPPPSAPAVVAAKQLPGGKQLTDRDLAVVRLPPDVVPKQAYADPAQVGGRTLAGPVSEGSVITEASVVSGRRLTSTPDRVIAPLHLPEASLAPLLRTGDLVDVVAVEGDRSGTARTVARGARVVSVPSLNEGPMGSSLGSSGLLILLEVDLDGATALAAASSGARLSILLH